MTQIHFREHWLIFLGNWGEAELILRIWGAKEKYFHGAEEFLTGIWEDLCIILSDQGSTDPPPPWGPHKLFHPGQYPILQCYMRSSTPPMGQLASTVSQAGAAPLVYDSGANSITRALLAKQSFHLTPPFPFNYDSNYQKIFHILKLDILCFAIPKVQFTTERIYPHLTTPPKSGPWIT